MDTDKVSVEVAGFMIMEAWFVIKKRGGEGCCFLHTKKEEEKEEMGEEGHVSSYNLNITNWFSNGNFSSVIPSAILTR